MAKTSSLSTADGDLTAFLGHRRIAAGSPAAITRAVRRALASDPSAPAPLVFDDASGAPVELDLRAGAKAAAPAPVPDVAPPAPGRPRLGVVAREVTLLPQHWEWLALQPGGASVALRKLVHAAQRVQPTQDALRAAQERCYLFLRAIAGDLPGYEEALRALFRGDALAFDVAAAGWPPDILAHARQLSAGAFVPADGAAR